VRCTALSTAMMARSTVFCLVVGKLDVRPHAPRGVEHITPEFVVAVRAWLDFAAEHFALAEEIAVCAAEQAAVVGSGRVEWTRTLPLEERAALAARPYIRHRHTDTSRDPSVSMRLRSTSTSSTSSTTSTTRRSNEWRITTSMPSSTSTDTRDLLSHIERRANPVLCAFTADGGGGTLTSRTECGDDESRHLLVAVGIGMEREPR